VGPAELRQSLSETLAAVARRNRGDQSWVAPRERYGIWHVVRVFLTCVLEGVCPGTLYERLELRQGYRRDLTLPNRLISLSQLKKRLRTLTFQRALSEILRESARRVLRKLGEEEVRLVAMDLTRLESDPNRDRKGAWGKDSQGFFWGYKLGLIMSEGGVVLGMTLMKGNWTEIRVGARLLKTASDVIETSLGKLPVQYVLCDSGFDADCVYEAAHKKIKARMICPPRRKRNPKAKTARNVVWNGRSRTPSRERDLPVWESREARELFKKRSGIERLNRQLKDTGIRIAEIPPRWRGVRKLGLLCLAKLAIYNLILNVNIEQGRPMRQLKVIAA